MQLLLNAKERELVLPAAQRSPPRNSTPPQIAPVSTLADRAGQSYEHLFNGSNTPSDPWAYMDPRVALRSKPSEKVVHITDFLNETAKTRRRNKRRDLVLSTVEGHDATVVLRPEEPHPYSGISFDEWSGANMRLLNHLLTCGSLLRENVDYYLAYTAIISDFYQKYEWDSILLFDFQYREQQAAYNFRWGYINPMMELQTLVPLLKGKDAAMRRTGPAAHNRVEECRQWRAYGHCRFGNSCKYTHVPRAQQPSTAPQTLQKN